MLKQHVKMVCMTRGVTMKQLADEMGVSNGALSMWVRQKSVPHSRLVPRIAAVLGLEPAELARMLIGPRP